MSREYTRMAHGGSDDINAQTMKLLIRDSGLTPPIGASPGELRLWIKKNGFDTQLAAKRDGREVPKATNAPPKVTNVPPPKKTAGRRGSRAGRPGNPAREPAADGDDGALEAQLGGAAGAYVGSAAGVPAMAARFYTDAIDDFKKEQAAAPRAKQPSMPSLGQQHYGYAGYGGIVPGAGGMLGDAGSTGGYGGALPQATDPTAYARLLQMQMQMQHAALVQQQWQLRQRQQSDQAGEVGAGVPPASYNWMQQPGAAALSYYYQQQQWNQPRPFGGQPQQYAP